MMCTFDGYGGSLDKLKRVITLGSSVGGNY